MADEIKVIMAESRPQAVRGRAGLRTHLPGVCITADAIGGVLDSGLGSLAQTSIDI